MGKKRRIVSLIVIFTVMVNALSIGSYADEVDIPNVSSSKVISEVVVSNPTEILNGEIQPFSTSRPTAYYDLSRSDYTANLECVGVNWLYTNYYFYPSSNGEIHVDYTIYSYTGRSTPMKIGFYDLTDKKWAADFTTSGSTMSGISEGMYAYNLNINHKYAVAFTAVQDGFTKDAVYGTAVISHG